MRGEFFSGSDIRSAARVALIGFKAAESLFEDEDPIGKQIEIGGSPFRIKGVLEEHGFDPHGMDLDDQVHVPITTMMRRIVNAQHIDSARLLLADGADLEAAVDDVTDVLRARHELGATVQDDFSIYTPNQVQRLVKEANQVVTVYLPATAAIALLVAAIVIANIMLMSVRERTPEIGLRKAVGATEGQIKGQFFAESLVTSLFSGLIGAGLGIAIVTVLGMHNTTITIAPDAVVFGLLTALVVGTFAGYLPARRAAGLEAVEALK
jgi:putative ABC transport system permease protein